jgi:5-methylcytosine-specific restriction endonuclease McrA
LLWSVKNPTGTVNMTDSENQSSEPLPFENYPHKGRNLLGRVRGDTCRHGYGLQLIKLTGQTKCAYCGIDLTEIYENWLNMALDHVIPHSACKSWGLPREWREDYSNRVLCCTTCNTFGNRYTSKGIKRPTTLEEFYNLRDIIFVERKKLVLERHREERAFFEQQLRTTRVDI